ncbi:hypothetical protein [Acinetobacter soli]|uniref:hypothetical protein n=1 Tax=Acinetobacter soli TaxID=487316 RepID=UPI0026E0BCDF|nr:hypothetical protein [Acinetobacter soli]
MSTTKIALLFLVYSTSNYIYADNTTVTPLGVIDIPKTTLSNESASSFFAAKDTYGMRSNAVVAAFQANPQKPFDFAILGFNNLPDMANYLNRDSVALFADNTAPQLKSWQIINNTQFTENSVTSNEIIESNIKVGMILDTDENDKWTTYVEKIEKNKLIVAGWINSKTKKTGIPKNGVRLLINPTTKIWATNFKVVLPQNSLAQSAVIQENGLTNLNIKKPIKINGIDTVVLPESKYGGNSAYLARSAVYGYKQKWLTGFMSQGNTVNFSSADSLVSSPSVGFLEDSHSQDGLVFNGKNTNSSITWKNNDRISALINPNGLITKIGYTTKIINTSTELSDDTGRYIVNTKKDITLKLPSIKKIDKGYTVKISKVTSGGSVTFFSGDVNITVNGQKTEKISEKQWNKEAFFDGENWYIL